MKKISIAETKLRRRNVIMKFDNLDIDILNEKFRFGLFAHKNVKGKFCR